MSRSSMTTETTWENWAWIYTVEKAGQKSRELFPSNSANFAHQQPGGSSGVVGGGAYHQNDNIMKIGNIGMMMIMPCTGNECESCYVAVLLLWSVVGGAAW